MTGRLRGAFFGAFLQPAPGDPFDPSSRAGPKAATAAHRLGQLARRMKGEHESATGLATATEQQGLGEASEAKGAVDGVLLGGEAAAVPNVSGEQKGLRFPAESFVPCWPQRPVSFARQQRIVQNTTRP